MKIIVSPSKTQKIATTKEKCGGEPMFMKQAEQLASRISRMNPDEIQDAFGVKGKLLSQTIQFYETFGKGPWGMALQTYTGQVFSQLAQDEREKNYFKDRLIILSALYGVLKSDDFIENYRLDLKVKGWEEGSLYAFWKPQMEEYFKGEGPLLNLASLEFSKLVPYPMTDVIFKEKAASGYRIIGTYSKIARGRLLRYMAEHEIEDFEAVKNFNDGGYRFDEKESSPGKMIFKRG